MTSLSRGGYSRIAAGLWAGSYYEDARPRCRVCNVCMGIPMHALPISRRYPLATRVMIGTLADAVLALVCFRLDLNLATTSLLFLLAVVAQSLGGGAVSSILASVIAAAFLDYFFVPPVLTWRISDPFNGIALIAFVSTSSIITSLASRARREAQTAERRRGSLEQLYRASQALISMPADAKVIETLVKTFRHTFGLRLRPGSARLPR